MSKRNMWRSVCEQLCSGDASFHQDVQLSISDPQSYFEKFEFALAQRGIDDPADVNPWLALIDGLETRGLLREFDWKLDANELAFQFERLLPCKKENVQLPKLRHSSAIGANLLHSAANELKSYSLGLVCLETNSDCYALMVVPIDNIPNIVELITSIGHNAVTVSPISDNPE